MKIKSAPFTSAGFYAMMILLVVFAFENSFAQYPAGSPVAINGKLSISGTKLVNKCGNTVQLRGMSSHGVQWFQQCYNNAALDALVNNWGIDVFRIAMYVQEGGYINNPAGWKTWIDNMVDQCAARGIYCIIDWHILNPGDPNANLTEARDFWSYMSNKHKNKDHVIYEIANEPNGVSWSTVKTYANDIIPRIRANDASTVVIVGTPTWSQDVDIAANDPLTFSNIMYALHFYSGTHGASLRTKADNAIARGLALFVTEFGTSAADGNGGPFLSPQTDDWMTWMNANKLSWVNWSYADKAETSAALAVNACAAGNWNSTSTSGAYIKNRILTPADNFVCSSGGNFTITSSAGAGGTITPSGSTSVPAGTNQSFTITPSTGFRINAVTVNGTSVGAVSTYTFTNVRSNQTIAATFTQSIGNFTITATAGTGGAISPSGSVSVAAGANRTFTITPTSGFQISGVTVNGTSIGNVSTYTFNNVQSNQTIAAAFQAVTSDNIVGPNCAAINSAVVYEVNVNRRVNATSYSWWYTGTTQNITPVSSAPYRATLNTGSGFRSGQVCVGVNYSQSPWHVTYCKPISVCASGARQASSEIVTSEPRRELQVSPNPFDQEFTISSADGIRSLVISDDFGQIIYSGGALSSDSRAKFGESLKPGLYILKIELSNGEVIVKRILKK